MVRPPSLNSQEDVDPKAHVSCSHSTSGPKAVALPVRRASADLGCTAMWLGCPGGDRGPQEQLVIKFSVRRGACCGPQLQMPSI